MGKAHFTQNRSTTMLATKKPADQKRKEQLDYALEYKLLRRGVEGMIISHVGAVGNNVPRTLESAWLEDEIGKLRKLLERVSVSGIPPQT